jgi:hypothetical protein
MTWGKTWTPPPLKRDQPPPPIESLRAVRPGSYGGTTAGPVPKGEYIRSEALMRAYRLIPCQNCGKDDGTVCGAHSNWGVHGKGRGIKASDVFAASLCFTCHGELDQGAVMGRSERFALWTVAHAKTIRELLARGLWPKGVPVPGVISD